MSKLLVSDDLWAIIAPLFLGLIADRFFASQIVMGVLMLVGGTIGKRRRTGIQRVVIETARSLLGLTTFDLVRWDAVEGRLRFTIGAAMELRQNFGDTSADQLVYGAGGTYNWDAWTVGLGWTRGDYEKAVGANGVGPFNAVHDDVALTASYALGPGISVDGLVEYSRYQSNDAAGPDYSGIGIGLGTAITF